MDWLWRQKRLLDPDDAVRLRNVTAEYLGLDIVGPLAESLLRAVSDIPAEQKDAMKYGAAQSTHAFSSVIALRSTLLVPLSSSTNSHSLVLRAYTSIHMYDVHCVRHTSVYVSYICSALVCRPMTCRYIAVGRVRGVLAMRLTHTGMGQ